MAPRGRPTTYTRALCTLMAEHRDAGGNLSTFAERYGILFRYINRWKARHPEFAAACRFGSHEDRRAEPEVTIRAPGAVIFSLAAWNIPRDLARANAPKGALTADEVDERLFGRQMEARAA